MADRFGVIFAVAVALTAFCGALGAAIAIWGPNPLAPPVEAFFETLKYGFTVGMLSIFGLLTTMHVGKPPRH